MMALSFSLFAYVQELIYSIVPLQLIRHLSLLRKHLSRMKKIWNEEMENNGQEGTPGRNRISRKPRAVYPRGFLERYCQSFLRFNWVSKVEKEVTPLFSFLKKCVAVFIYR